MSDHLENPAELHGYGRVDWPTARRLLAGCACTWSDLDGVRLADEPPAEMPVGATHLWGWSAERLFRLRFDTGPDLGAGAGVYVAVLGRPVDGVASSQRVPMGNVTHRRQTVRLRPEDDARSGELPVDVRERDWEVYEVPGVAPVTFLRACG